jgi:hypothetical protein
MKKNDDNEDEEGIKIKFLKIITFLNFKNNF